MKISKGAKKIWVQRVAKTYGFKGLRKIMVSKGYEKLWFQGVAKKIWLIRVVKKILRMVAKKKFREKAKICQHFHNNRNLFCKRKKKGSKGSISGI